MSDIHWLNNAVCHAKGKQWFSHTSSSLMDSEVQTETTRAAPLDCLIKQCDYQLNEIREGDFIPASKLDTEQKYNDVVEVFGLFWFYFKESAVSEFKELGESNSLVCCDDGLWQTNTDIWNNRQLTHSQIIAIGKLKRMMLEGEKSNSTEIPNSSDQVKNPKHYQLVDGIESIEIIARSMTKEQFKGYCLGNMLKYRLRAGKKDALQQDIEKANFYGELYEMHKDKCYD